MKYYSMTKKPTAYISEIAKHSGIELFWGISPLPANSEIVGVYSCENYCGALIRYENGNEVCGNAGSVRAVDSHYEILIDVEYDNDIDKIAVIGVCEVPVLVGYSENYEDAQRKWDCFIDENYDGSIAGSPFASAQFVEPNTKYTTQLTRLNWKKVPQQNGDFFKGVCGDN